MVGDMLGYPSVFQPVFQRCLCHGVFEIREHLATFLWRISYQLQGFFTDRIMHDVLCLLHSSGDIHHAIVAVWLYFFPSELLDVALSQCRWAREQEGSLQGRSRAWCGCQADNLVLRKMFLIGALIKAGVDPYIGVMHRDDYNRPVLVYDVIELFRVWVDYVVFSLLCQNVISEEHYSYKDDGACWLEPLGRRVLIQSLNDYLDEVIEDKGTQRSRLTRISLYAQSLAQVFKKYA